MAANKVIYKNAYDKKVSAKFFRYYILKNSVFIYLFTVFGLVALFMLVSGAFDQEKDSTYFLMWVIAIMGIVFVPTYIFVNIRASVRRDFKRRGTTIEQIEFSKEKITREELTKHGKMVINWVSIANVIENEDAFYIFLSSDEAFTVAKSGLVEGTVEATRELMLKYLKPDQKGRLPIKIKDKEYNAKQRKLKKEAKLAKKANKK